MNRFPTLTQLDGQVVLPMFEIPPPRMSTAIPISNGSQILFPATSQAGFADSVANQALVSQFLLKYV